MNSQSLPLVSVLIAAYNAKAYIVQAVDSIKSQDYTNIEIIVCNDCSTDGTEILLDEIAKTYSNVRIINNEKNLGYLRTFNKLLKAAKGDYISFLDADDYIAPEKISKQVSYLVNNPNVGVVGCQNASVSDNGKIISVSSFPTSHLDICLEMKNEMCFCGSSVMLRRCVLDEVGGYREFFIGCVAEDYDWLYRMIEKYESANLDYVGYYYRFHTSSLTRRINFSIKKRHIHDIVRLLAQEREAVGSDLVSRGDNEQLNEVLRLLEQPYKEDKGLLYKKIIIEYSINKDWENARMYFKRLIKISGFNLKIFIMMYILLFFNHNFLLSIKNFLHLSHLSSRV